jgi:proteic killer suppression protein
VIENFKNAKTRRVYETGAAKGFKGLDSDKALRRLDMLAASDSIDDFPKLASVGLHRLKGARKGQWAMTVNKRWRIVFLVDENGRFRDVEIIDYHKG